MRKVIAHAVGILVLVGCSSTSDVSVASPTTPAITTVVTGPGVGADRTHFDVDSLGLSFSLPSTFHLGQDPDLLFVGRSLEPQALLTIDKESPGVVDHKPRAGETLSGTTIDGFHAVVVADAAVAGLPVGIASVEL